jgi:hypothetical protein
VFGEAVYADNDRDGLPDEYEREQDLDPYEPSDACLDSDGDGVDKATEFEAGSNPNDELSTPAILKLVLSRESVIVPEGVGPRWASSFRISRGAPSGWMLPAPAAIRMSRSRQARRPG